MSVHRTKALFALGFAALTGCEAVAGIRDITLEQDASPSPDAAENASDAAIDQATLGDEGDSTVSPDRSSTPGTGDGMSIDSASSTSAEAQGVDHDGGPAEAAEAGSTGDSRVIVDATADSAEAGPVEAQAGGDSAGDADAGSLVGPDGGLLTTELIDDMESQTGAIALTDGRDGFWFVFDDNSDAGILMPPFGGQPTAIIAAIVPPRGTSNFAAHERGSGFPQYAGMGFNMSDVGGTKHPYDASAFQGFVFWGRSPNGSMNVRFNVPDVNTDPAGGICTTACNDHFGVVRTLTTDWQQFFVFYSQLAQQGFGHPNGSDDGGPTSLDTTQIYGCQLLVTAPTSTTAFDVWIDDISFIRK